MLRPVDVHDVRFLRDMLRHAYHWRLSEDTERPVYRYVANWGRRGDAGVMALDGPHAYGAAWYRLFTAAEPGFGFVDETTPELTIAVVPSRRGKGHGAELLDSAARARPRRRPRGDQPERGAGAVGVLRDVRLRDRRGEAARRDDARPPERLILVLPSLVALQ